MSRMMKLTISVNKDTIDALLALRHTHEAEELRVLLGCASDIDISRCDFYKRMIKRPPHFQLGRMACA